MMDSSFLKIDVLLCVGPRDIHGLFVDSLLSCIKNFTLLGHIYIVTPAPQAVEKILRDLGLTAGFTILPDEAIIEPYLAKENGWYKQQIIRLQADTICSTKFIVCMSSDTVLLRKLTYHHLFDSKGFPILYYRNYDKLSPHFAYEQERLKAVSKVLQVPTLVSSKYVDFILDFTLWNKDILSALRQYLAKLYGPYFYQAISPGKCGSLESKKAFGEWTLYAAFVLDVIKVKPTLKGFDDRYFTQIHNSKYLTDFDYSSVLVHFVDKALNYSAIKQGLKPFIEKQQ